MVGGGELAVLGGDHEGLWNKVKMLRPLRVLKPLDVLVQSILASQFVGSEKNNNLILNKPPYFTF
jgi:hypothetical protein